MNKIILFFAATFILVSCQNQQQERVENIHMRNTMATLYVQQSPEYVALAEQAYNMARLSLNEQLAHTDKPLAVVTDIDETVLDNSPFEAKQILENFDYSDSLWDEWVYREEASQVPGSLAFFKYADSLDVTIYYISNRKAHLLDATINNLKKLGYPQADSSHVYLKTTTSSKEERRNKVLSQGFDIALFLGDNLNDMSAQFETNDMEARANAVDTNQPKFGTKYIVFPNPTYGNWALNRGFYNPKLNQDSLATVYLKAY